ncbi:MAG: glycosyltransferase family 2 protein [Acidobacteriaceae bacterium]
MSFLLLTHVAFWCAVIPASLLCWNLLLFREPPPVHGGHPAISVLIPARNEEDNIGAAIENVLASTSVDLELIVLDDASTDRTAEIIQSFAARDGRVRYASGAPLAAGWAGKAHAAHELSELANHATFCFLDADVRVAPAALARMHRFMERSGSALVSGFPHEETVTFLEWLLLPLIHFLLLGYLPLAGMRAFPTTSGFGAGCGQFLMMRRDAYLATGGYSSVRGTMHDGIVLAKLFRQHGFATDIADMTKLARCRMYRSAAETWNGLVKNATEGLAAPARIVPFTLLLLCGQVLPFALLVAAALRPQLLALHHDSHAGRTLAIVLAASLLPRVLCVLRFRQRIAAAVFHPVAILVLIALQWYALGRKLLGLKTLWKERAFSVG